MSSRVSVYRNLHRETWSLLGREGRLLDHRDALVLTDVIFVVRPAGHARALREKRRNVHAFVRGILQDGPSEIETGSEVRYNPFAGPHFTLRTSGLILTEAPHVIFGTDGRCYLPQT